MTIRHFLHVFSHACCSCCTCGSPPESGPPPPPSSSSAAAAADDDDDNPATQPSPPPAAASSSTPDCSAPPPPSTSSSAAADAAAALPDHPEHSSSAIDYDQRLLASLKLDLQHERCDVTVKDLDKFIQDLQSRIDHMQRPTKSGSSVQGEEDRDPSMKIWKKCAPNTSALFQELNEKAEVTAKGVIKDTVLPLLLKTSEKVPVLQWAALSLSLIAWGLDTLDKQHKNFRDCLELFKDTVFLLMQTKNIMSREDIDALSSELMQCNLQRILEAAFEVVCIASFCSIDSTSKRVGTFLGAASLEAVIKDIKERIEKLTRQNDSIADDLDRKSNSRRTLTKQLSSYRTRDSEGDDALAGRANQAREILEILRQDGEEIIAVCLHGMGGVGKSTLALQVFNEFLKQKRFHACSRVEVYFKMRKEDIPRFQSNILKDIDTESESGCMSLEANISDALNGQEQLQRAFEKSGGPILLYIDNAQQAQYFRDLLPEVKHLPRGSRLLVTTRNQKISACLSEMGVKEDRCRSISVDTLKTEESRDFLRKWALRMTEDKEIIDKNQTLKELEDEVLRMCNGLPLALKLMGSYIAQSKKGAENVDTWRHVVESMKEGRPIDGDKNDELYARLRVTIDVLDESLRQDLSDMVACNYFQQSRTKWRIVSVLGEGGMQNLMDRHILEDEGEYDVGCHDVIQSLIKNMAKTNDELRVTSEDPELMEDELPHIVTLERSGAVITDVRQLNRMTKLRFAVNVRVKTDEAPPPPEELVQINLRHLKVLELKMDDGVANRRAGPLLKIGRCPELRVLATCGDVLAWQETREQLYTKKLTYLEVEECNQLQEEHLRRLPSMTSLSFLNLTTCNSLTTFPPRDTSAAAATQDLFRSLKSIYIQDCQNLGEITETIQGLSQLTYLSATGCRNLRHLPNGIGQLTNLQSLSIGECRRLEAIPETISRLSQLTILSMYLCENLRRIPDGIGHLSNLQKLDMDYCESLGEIPETIGRLSQLTSLSAMRCTNLRHLPDGIGQLTNLKWLWIGACRRLEAIPETISRLSQLTILSMYSCENLRRIPDGIGHLSNLQKLDMDDCESLVEIPETILRLSQLTSLSARRCTNLGHLPNGIGQLTSLKSLWIDACRRLEEIPESIGGLSQLTELCFGPCMNRPNWIGYLANLQWLTLYDCRNLRGIPDTMQRLSQLNYLALKWCTNLIHIPNGIGQLSHLQTLSLDGCSRLQRIPDGLLENLAGQGILSIPDLGSCWRLQTLPEGISQCTSLKILDLRYCASLGCIPIGVRQLTNLEILNLRGCTSLPMLPDDLFQNLVGSLSFLNLNGCRSLETLPEGISLLRCLKNFNLEKCRSLRCIPEGLQQNIIPQAMAKREALSLDGCAGLRKLPCRTFDSLGRSLSKLYLKDCSELELLPEGISLLTTLTELHLNGCRSLQCIPDGIQKLANLQYLYLRGCTCLQKLPHDMFKNIAGSLSKLDLSFCERLETIPPGISELTSLTELRLEQCESLQHIPKGMMELPRLRSLNLRGCTGLSEEDLPHGAFRILAGRLLARERKMLKTKNLQRHLLYMVSL